MKRIFSLALVLIMSTLLFVGCSDNSNSQGSSSDNSSSNNNENSGTDTSWDDVKEKGELIVGFDAGFPPMGYLDTESGDYIGFDLSVAEEVCSRLGLTLKKQPIAWSAKEQELDSKNIDCIWNGVSWTQEREDAMLLSKPYMQNNQVLLTLSDSEYKTIESLKDQEIGVQTQSSAESALNNDENADFRESLKNIIGLEDYTTGVTELKQGTIKALAIDEVVARHYVADEPDAYALIADADGNDAVLAKEGFVIAFRKADTALEAKIYETLLEMKNDGKLAEISTEWFDKDITTIS